MEIKATQLPLAAHLSCRLGMIFFFKTKWPGDIIRKKPALVSNLNDAPSDVDRLDREKTKYFSPSQNSRFNLVKRNAMQGSLRSNSFPGSLFFYGAGGTETLETRFRCVTTWFNVTHHSSSSVTKLLLIDTFGYIDRNSRTSSLDNREQKETSSSFKCLHCFNNLRKP